MTTHRLSGRTALVTGATGYIGGALVPALLEQGWRVRVLSRRPSALSGRDWAEAVEVVQGDAGELVEVRRALAGVDVAYYLLHSMDGRGDFVARDRHLAETFADAAAHERVGRVVYLSGLRNRIQPIAVDDVVHYLLASADLGREVNRAFDIGGPDVLTYAEMMRRYAVVAGLGSRWIATVPVLTPRLAGFWMGLVTPVPAGIARPLVGSLVHEAVCREDDILDVTGPPPGGRTGFDAAYAAWCGFATVLTAAIASRNRGSGRRV